MTTPAPKVGDPVDVTIRGAKVESTFNRGLFLDFGGETFIPMDNPSVTVTPHAAGEAEGLDLEAEDEIDNLKAVIETLHAQLDRLRAPAGIEAAWAPCEVGCVPSCAAPRCPVHGYAVLRAAAGHLDAGRAEVEAEEAWEEVANLKAVIEVIQCARADLEADNARLRGDRALALDDLRSASDTVAALRAELAEARTTIRAFVGSGYFPARTSKMRLVWLAPHCGHIVFSAGRPEHRCIECDPDCTDMKTVDWQQLYIHRTPEATS